MTPQRVTLITVGVDDLTRSKAFYTKLGWTPHPSPAEEVVFYQIHGAVLGLFGRDALAKDQGREGTKLGTGTTATPAISRTLTGMFGNWP